jgi:hypothetical protein
MNIKLLKHEKNRSGYFFKHKALVEITGEIDLKEQKEEIINETSIKVGYHPLGYGVYGGKISKSAREGQYIIVWETGTSAD